MKILGFLLVFFCALSVNPKIAQTYEGELKDAIDQILHEFNSEYEIDVHPIGEVYPIGDVTEKGRYRSEILDQLSGQNSPISGLGTSTFPGDFRPEAAIDIGTVYRAIQGAMVLFRIAQNPEDAKERVSSSIKNNNICPRNGILIFIFTSPENSVTFNCKVEQE